MPIEARGNYLPEASYLRETKIYLNCNCKPPFWKPLNRYISANFLTDFHEICYSDAFWYPAPDVQFKFVIFDNLIWQYLMWLKSTRVRHAGNYFVPISIRPIFTARCYASAVLAMGLCPSVCVCVSLSVCLSQAGVLLKRQNVGSQKEHHTIPQGL